MAIADADYKFMYIDVGAHDSEGDANVFGTSSFGEKIISDTLPITPDATIGSSNVPYFFDADDAFPLKKRIMKPFCPSRGNALSDKERISNYRLSRARRCIENAFGILSAKWMCLN